eukprot:GHVT01045268.1.p1 GENE.GHVT01045268.1~~GHVT01045268.1.p1  ORF type:complete len:1016 (+),score=109.60 GHVT01045268.1:1290-4337(+)
MCTFTGSLLACGKLAGTISPRPRMVPCRWVFTVILLVLLVGSGTVCSAMGLYPSSTIGMVCLFVCVFCSGIYGFVFVFAIGGADMPVVISILNSASGWSCVFAGLTLQNSLMIIAGAFVGASGIILSYVMCKAMNRSLTHVLLGGFGDQAISKDAKTFHGKANVFTVDEAVNCLASARSVAIVPGYGMAVSRAQFAVWELCSALTDRGVSVKFGVHPVAGRLPGHMNVLLAEANVPYDLVFPMEEINPDFPSVDVSLIIGANDTVNPAAQTEPGCAIYGMPVLEVWKAKQTIVLKRSLNVGYAGVDNPLFLHANNAMLLGDAKKSVSGLVTGIVACADGTLPSRELSKTSIAVPGLTHGTTTRDSNSPSAGAAANKAPFFPSVSWNVGVLKEDTAAGEMRVAIVPKEVLMLRYRGVRTLIEHDAGTAAGFDDKAYLKAEGQPTTRSDIFKNAKCIIKVTAFTQEEVQMLQSPQTQLLACGFMGLSQVAGDSASSNSAVATCMEMQSSLLSLDLLPRVSTAQCMDVLSSTAKLAGARAVVEALQHYNRLPGAEITAAGSYPPAKALIIGAGVAGLQAIGAAHRLGAEVRAFDIRLDCKEQVESMGGKYLVLDFPNASSVSSGGYACPMSPEFIEKEMALFALQAKEIDILITTAAIPGRRAPLLIKKEHVDLMKPGSVIVDVAAASGGNCEVTIPGSTYTTHNKVVVVGDTNLPAKLCAQASEMFSVNIWNLFEYLGWSKVPPAVTDEIAKEAKDVVGVAGDDAQSNESSNGNQVVVDAENPNEVLPISGAVEFPEGCASPSIEQLNMKDVIVRSITVCHQGELLFPPPRPPPPPAASAAAGDGKHAEDGAVPPTVSVVKRKHRLTCSRGSSYFYLKVTDVLLVLTIACLTALFATTAPPSFTMNLFVFMLSSWVGYMLIWNVTAALHTPLMSLSNAISGVVLLGGMLGISEFAHSKAEDVCRLDRTSLACTSRGTVTNILNATAIAVASMNVFGGFAVTQRMLRMFRKARPKVQK